MDHLGIWALMLMLVKFFPPHNDAHSLIAVQASEGSSSFPLSEDLPAITTTGVLEGGFVPWSDCRDCGVGGTDAFPPSPKALLCVSVWKRPLAGCVASDCSLGVHAKGCSCF